MDAGLNVYGLLYVDPNNNRHANMQSRRSPVDIYLLCAASCSESFRKLGVDFKIITNNGPLLAERMCRLNISGLAIVEHEFALPVPTGIPFFSAHFKLELYGAFASGDYGEHVALIDIDTLLLRALPASENLAAYDISDQVFPRYGRDTVTRDLQIVTGKALPDGRWYGGEFVMGSAAQFSELAKFIDCCWPRYLVNIKKVHHLGDEMVLSAALNLYSEQHRLADYGAQGDVARWWSTRTYNRQASLHDARKAALLHLPADKLFIARFNLGNPAHGQMMEEYRNYARRKILMRSVIPRLGLFGSRKFLPRLT